MRLTHNSQIYVGGFDNYGNNDSRHVYCEQVNSPCVHNGLAVCTKKFPDLERDDSIFAINPENDYIYPEQRESHEQTS